MIIRLVYEMDGVLGFDRTTTEGMDIQASVAKYEEMLTDALQERFPGAEVEITSGDYSKLTVLDTDDDVWDESIVREIDSRIYEGFDWVVRS